jgi:hypothetical protein
MFSPFILAGCFQVGLSNITITLNNVKGEKNRIQKSRRKINFKNYITPKDLKNRKKGLPWL